jgi:hypothetical protein
VLDNRFPNHRRASPFKVVGKARHIISSGTPGELCKLGKSQYGPMGPWHYHTSPFEALQSLCGGGGGNTMTLAVKGISVPSRRLLTMEERLPLAIITDP